VNPLIPAWMARQPTPTTRHTDPAVSHESFIHGVRAIVADRAPVAARQRLLSAKLVYGAGSGEYRGVCFYQAWTNGDVHEFVEIAATGEESNVQLAGTTIHELGHVLAGPGAGHGPGWRTASRVLGLTVTSAAGQAYAPEHFAPDVWRAIERLAFPTDGRPTFRAIGPVVPKAKLRPCPMGIGTRGGRSRGPGSGSRLRLWECQCQVRVARDHFDATCNVCHHVYTKRG
jgi:hypothetical protein